jgi:predicted enzyme related to lactoylglutathione lyase
MTKGPEAAEPEKHEPDEDTVWLLPDGAGDKIAKRLEDLGNEAEANGGMFPSSTCAVDTENVGPPRSVLLPRLSLLVIRAIDPSALAQFYSALGIQFQTEQHGGGPVHYVSIDAGVTLEIYPRRDGEAATTNTRLGFSTVDLDVVLNALEARGGEISTPAGITAWGRRAVVTDPEGHTVEVTEQEAIVDHEGRLTLAGETWLEAQRRGVGAAWERYKAGRTDGS